MDIVHKSSNYFEMDIFIEKPPSFIEIELHCIIDFPIIKLKIIGLFMALVVMSYIFVLLV